MLPLPTNFTLDASGHVKHHNDVSYELNTSVTNRPVTLRDNPALDPTGAADSSAAFQAALDAAGPRTVEIGREGKYRLDSGLTMVNFQTLQGAGPAIGAGDLTTQLWFPNLTGSAVGITGVTSTIRDLMLWGPGAGVGTTTGFKSAAGSPRFHNVNFYHWAIGHNLTGAYYTTFNDCEWRFNAVAGKHTGCYNLHFVVPRVYCMHSTPSVYGQGFDGAGTDLVIHGGSIEAYGATGGVKAYSSQGLRLRDVYFESGVGSGGIGVDAAAQSKVSISATGCRVYLSEMNRWINLTSATGSVLTAEGNAFTCSVGSGTNPIAYVVPTSGVKGRVGYDNWSQVLAAGATYVTGAILNQGVMADLPIKHPAYSYVGDDIAGTGSPEAVIPAAVGNIYRRLDGGAGTSIYIKQSGGGTSAGWVAK